jgi:type II secretory pathway pseudopilin PulG
LIELLVVIAIISVLAALIFPGIQKANATTRTMKCMGTLRQWAVAFPLYAQDNNGYLPTAHLTVNTESQWQNRIAPYVAGTNEQYDLIKLRLNFHCPGDTAASTGWCYATNLYLITPPSGPAFNRFTDIPHPEITLMLEEANACGVWSLAPSTDPAAGMQYAHHANGLANFAFADMHMQSISSTDAPALLAANKILLNPLLIPAH